MSFDAETRRSAETRRTSSGSGNFVLFSAAPRTSAPLRQKKKSLIVFDLQFFFRSLLNAIAKLSIRGDAEFDVLLHPPRDSLGSNAAPPIARLSQLHA